MKSVFKRRAVTRLRDPVHENRIPGCLAIRQEMIRFLERMAQHPVVTGLLQLMGTDEAPYCRNALLAALALRSAYFEHTFRISDVSFAMKYHEVAEDGIELFMSVTVTPDADPGAPAVPGFYLKERISLPLYDSNSSEAYLAAAPAPRAGSPWNRQAPV